MWYYISHFYPPDKTTLPFAIVEAGISVSHTVAGPLAAALLSLDGLQGLSGWQWLFMLEGLPCLLLGICFKLWLPENIQVRWARVAGMGAGGCQPPVPWRQSRAAAGRMHLVAMVLIAI